MTVESGTLVTLLGVAIAVTLPTTPHSQGTFAMVSHTVLRKLHAKSRSQAMIAGRVYTLTLLFKCGACTAERFLEADIGLCSLQPEPTWLKPWHYYHYRAV